MSVEVRSLWYVDQDGTSRLLSPDQLLKRRIQLDAMGGPCDIREWKDVSPAERELLRTPPVGH